MPLLSGSNIPRFSQYTSDIFTGNGVNTTFTLTQIAASPSSLIITINGVKQHSDTYAVSGNQIIFTEAPPNNSKIEVVALGAKGTVQTVADNSVTPQKLDREYLPSNGGTINGSLVINSNTNDQFRITDGTQNLYIDTDSNGVAISGGAGQTGPGVYLFNSQGSVNLFTNNTLRVRVDSNGRMTNPFQIAFDVSSTAGVSDGNVQSYNTVYVNRGSHFSTSTSRFTAPVTGCYIFSAATIKAGVNSGGVGRLYLRRNGTIVHGSRHLRLSEGSSYGDGSCTWLLELTANDYVDVYMGGNTGSHGSVEYTWFNGYLLG